MDTPEPLGVFFTNACSQLADSQSPLTHAEVDDILATAMYYPTLLGVLRSSADYINEARRSSDTNALRIAVFNALRSAKVPRYDRSLPTGGSESSAMARIRVPGENELSSASSKKVVLRGFSERLVDNFYRQCIAMGVDERNAKEAAARLQNRAETELSAAPSGRLAHVASGLMAQEVAHAIAVSRGANTITEASSASETGRPTIYERAPASDQAQVTGRFVYELDQARTHEEKERVLETWSTKNAEVSALISSSRAVTREQFAPAPGGADTKTFVDIALTRINEPVTNVEKLARAATVLQSQVAPRPEDAWVPLEGPLGALPQSLQEVIVQKQVRRSVERVLSHPQRLVDALGERVVASSTFQEAINSSLSQIHQQRSAAQSIGGGIVNVFTDAAGAVTKSYDEEVVLYIELAHRKRAGLPPTAHEAMKALADAAGRNAPTHKRSESASRSAIPGGHDRQSEFLPGLLHLAQRYKEAPQVFAQTFTVLRTRAGYLLSRISLPAVRRIGGVFVSPILNVGKKILGAFGIQAASTAASTAAGAATGETAAATVGTAVGGPVGFVVGAAVGIITGAATRLFKGFFSGGVKGFIKQFTGVIDKVVEGDFNLLTDSPMILLGGIVMIVLLPVIMFASTEIVRDSAAALSLGGGSYGEPPAYDGPAPPPAEIIGCPVNGGRIAQCPNGSFSHGGVDAYDFGGLPMWSPIYAAHDGYVATCVNTFEPGQTTTSGNYGNYVVLVGTNSSGQRFFTYYAHLATVSEQTIAADDRGCGTRTQSEQLITAGTVIGFLDHTGYSTHPHLHYEYRGPGRLQLPVGCAGYNGSQCR